MCMTDRLELPPAPGPPRSHSHSTWRHWAPASRPNSPPFLVLLSLTTPSPSAIWLSPSYLLQKVFSSKARADLDLYFLRASSSGPTAFTITCLVISLQTYVSGPSTTLKFLMWTSNTCLRRNISTFSKIKSARPVMFPCSLMALPPHY